MRALCIYYRYHFIFSGKLVPFLENTVASASVLTILAISSERYKVICRPLRAPSRGSCGFVKVIVGLWLMAFATSSPFLAITVYRNSRHVDGTLIKVCRTTINETWEKCFIVLLSSFFFTIPLSILIGLYCRVGRQLFAFREDGMNIGEKKFKEKLRLRRQVTNMIVTVVVMFFICHLPYRLIGLWLIFDPMVAFSWGFEKYLNIIYGARVILYLNHALNPIMYNFVSSKFRSSLKWMIYSLPKKRQGSSKYTSANNNRRLGFRSHSPNSRFKCSQSEIKEVQVSDRQANTDSRSSSSVRQHINDFSNMYSTLTSAPHMTSVTHRTSADHTTPADLTAECDCAEQLRPQKTLSCDTPNVHFCIQSSKIYISLNMDVQTDRDKNNHHPRHENEAGAFEETSY